MNVFVLSESEKKLFSVLGSPETPAISVSTRAPFDGSQALDHCDRTKKSDLCSPGVKARREQLFFSELSRHAHYLTVHVTSRS